MARKKKGLEAESMSHLGQEEERESPVMVNPEANHPGCQLGPHRGIVTGQTHVGEEEVKKKYKELKRRKDHGEIAEFEICWDDFADKNWEPLRDNSIVVEDAEGDRVLGHVPARLSQSGSKKTGLHHAGNVGNSF